MLPSINPVIVNDEVETARTSRINFRENVLSGEVDGLEAVKQAVYIIMNTERYRYLIHSWDFGIELQDLIGKDMDYVETELERRIQEALLSDDRISSVEDFSYERQGRKLSVTFTVVCNYGSFSDTTELEF